MDLKNLTDWEGNTNEFTSQISELMEAQDLFDNGHQPTVRLVRDYVSRGILTKPKRKGKEAIFGYTQLVQFLACRALLNDGWPLKKIADDFNKSSLKEILPLIPKSKSNSEALNLISSFKDESSVESTNGRQAMEVSKLQLSTPEPMSHEPETITPKMWKTLNNAADWLSRSSRHPKQAKEKIVLDKDYIPNENEPFMSDKQLEYFHKKLLDWKSKILVGTQDTIKGMQSDTRNIPAVADHASEETDRALELRTRDRQRKLIAKIDGALRRIENGEYGYCDVTGEPISLKRLNARPIATMSLEAQVEYERKEQFREASYAASDVQRKEEHSTTDSFSNRIKEDYTAEKELALELEALDVQNSQIEVTNTKNLKILPWLNLNIDSQKLEKITREQAKVIASVIEKVLLKNRNIK